MSRYPDSQYLYISYGFELAAKHTEFIRRIIQCPLYGKLFDIYLRHDMKAKDHFVNNRGGSIKAFGMSGPIVGQDGGLPNCDRFSGAIIMDDLHKPDEVHSDTIRMGVIKNYQETIIQRPRSPLVPMIFLGQRLHEDDLPAFFLSGKDERKWKSVVLQAIDGAGNALYPQVNPLAQLLEKKLKNPYVFSSQYQQEPVPSGGALFKEKDFAILDADPEFICTFLTVDSAETAESYNDATVFSFWGLYRIADFGQEVEDFALHWIDCWEMRVEPKELEPNFKSFWAECMLYKTKPRYAAIEKKSSGVTLCSVLSDMRGLEIKDVKRSRASGSKTARYIEMQPIIASKLVSFTRNAKHLEACIKHMIKITANNSHRHDDVCHVAGSKIATLRGSVNVEDIRIGDKIITPFGVGLVSACGMTGYHEVINKLGLESTPNHQVFTNRGFLALDSVCDADKIDSLSFTGLLLWRLKGQLYLMETNIHAAQRESIIAAAQGREEMKPFIGLCLDFIAAKKYRTVMMFITRMVIALITVLRIWSCYRGATTLRNIRSKLEIFSSCLRCGTQAARVENGIGKTLSQRMAQGLKNKARYVLFATRSLFTQGWELLLRHVALNVIPSSTGAILETSPPIARSAGMNLPLKSIIPNQEIEKPAPINAEETIRPSNIKAVYAITVEIFGVYYCNGVLLRNCDTVYDAIKIALIDKTLHAVSYKDEGQREASRMNNAVYEARQRAIREARGY